MTQYVYLNHNVTFECATNSSGYTLHVAYGQAVNAIESDLGQLLTTTFNVTSELNGTVIYCITRMGSTVNYTNIAYAYVQGNLIQ